MQSTPKFKRVLLKLSGEAIRTQNEVISFEFLSTIMGTVRKCLDCGTEIAIVIGAGNIWRGRQGSSDMDQSLADRMGMLATTINSLAVSQALTEAGIPSVVMAPPQVTGFAEAFDPFKAKQYLSEGKVVIVAGGTGSPYFTTDTAAALRAAEIGADAVLFAKNIDGIYTDDPNKNPEATKYDELSYSRILKDNLKAIDLAAAAFCHANGIRGFAFGLAEPDNIYKIVMGERVGTELHP